MATLTITQPVTVELPPMSEDEFFDFCQRNHDLRIERTAEGEIIIMPPTGSATSDRNAEIIGQLRTWANESGRGRAFDSSGGFTLPSGAVRSPDAAWIANVRIEALQDGDFEQFAHICPEFVIELLSRTDSLRAAQRKMQEWISNGTELGWLLDPYERVVYEYTGYGMRRIDGVSEVEGHGPVDGFILDLRKIWK